MFTEGNSGVKQLSSIVVLLVLLCFAGAPAHARANNYTRAQKQAQKNWEKYAKQQAKIQKKQLKAAEKAAKKYNQQHHALTTTGR